MRTTQSPDTELLAKNVQTLSPRVIPRLMSWFFVQLYVGSWTEEPIAVRNAAASIPRTRPRNFSACHILRSASKELL